MADSGPGCCGAGGAALVGKKVKIVPQNCAPLCEALALLAASYTSQDLGLALEKLHKINKVLDEAGVVIV